MTNHEHDSTALVTTTAITKAHNAVAEQFVQEVRGMLSDFRAIKKYAVDEDYYSQVIERLTLRVNDAVELELTVTRRK